MAAKKNSKNTVSKADFIRAQPHDMPAKEVVAKATEASMKLSEAHVHAVRSSDKARAKKKNKAPKSTTAATKTSSKKKSSGKRGRKSKKKGLVQSLKAANPTWTAAQIAKEAGCSVKYVYLTWNTKQTASPTKTAKAASAKKPAAATSGSTTEFYKVLKRVGVDEAKRLIANIEAYENA